MVNLGLIKALIESSELSEITTITSITTSDNKIIFNTESGSYTVTIPEPVLGVDKIDIENKNLKIRARSDIFRPCFYIMYKIINIFINFSAIPHIVLLTFGRCKFNIKLTEIF